MDDGNALNEQRQRESNKNSIGGKNQMTAASEQNLILKKVSSHSHFENPIKNKNSVYQNKDLEKLTFLTPLDLVINRSQKHLADKIEENFHLISGND